jgi:2-hydroxychromene-2-carboxylate isomerase
VPELAEEYRRYHLRAAGRATPAVGIEAAFNEAFPLPGDLEQALRTAIRNTLAPPSG